MNKTVPLASLISTPGSTVPAKKSALKSALPQQSETKTAPPPVKRHSAKKTQRTAVKSEEKVAKPVKKASPPKAGVKSPRQKKAPATTQGNGEHTALSQSDLQPASNGTTAAGQENGENLETILTSSQPAIKAVSTGAGNGDSGGNGSMGGGDDAPPSHDSNMGNRPNEWVNQESIHIWPHQSRQEINQVSIHHMADSLLEKGQLNPGHTFVDDQGSEWLITGQRRLLGLRLLIERGLKPQDAPFQIIRLGHMTHAEAMTISLVENFQRDGLTLKDQVTSIDVLYSEQHLTPARIASQVGLSETQVRRYISFKSLNDETMAEVDAGIITSEQAELLARASEHMRPTVRGWIREGKLSVADMNQMISQQSSVIYMRDALFSEEDYRSIAGPKGVTQSLFDGDIATDRSVFMSLQRTALEEQIQNGQYGTSSEYHVLLAAEIPSDRRMEEDENGTVIVGLINPSNGQTRVLRCRHRTDAPEADLPLSERERALANVRARMAREVVRGHGLGLKHLASEQILLTLLVQQLGGGERAFALGQHESGELLGLANPVLGFEDHMYHQDNTSHVAALLRHCYQGTFKTHRIILLNAGVKEVEGGAFATETGSRELSLLFPGISGQREQLIEQARHLRLNLELQPIRSATEQLREAARALKEADILTPEAQALIEVSDQLQAGEAVTDGRILTVWEEWTGALQHLTAGHRNQIMSASELVALYEIAGDSEDERAFKAAIEADNYALASKLASNVRKLN